MRRTIIIISVLLSVLFTSCTTAKKSDAFFQKRVLITGDSITEGELGLSYVDPLSEMYPEFELINLGRDGDTLLSIMDRTIEHLRRDSDYDLIIIEAGHNDILLPSFRNRTIIHQFVASHMVGKGNLWAGDADEFISIYSFFIDSVRGVTKVPVYITTLSCLSEDLDSATNKLRREYNIRIRALAEEKGTGLIDVGADFDSILAQYQCRDYLMDDMMGSALSGRRISRSADDADNLSRERGLYLTIDGGHLNSRGARLYTDAVSDVFTSEFGK